MFCVMCISFCEKRFAATAAVNVLVIVATVAAAGHCRYNDQSVSRKE